MVYRHYLGGLASLVTCFLVVAFNTGFAKQKIKWGKVTPEEWSLTAPSELPDAPAVVVFDVGSLEVKQPYKGNLIAFKRHVRMKIFSKEGATDAISVEIPHWRDEKFKEFAGHTILPDGKKVKVEKQQTFKKTDENIDVVSFTFPAVENGCIVEYKYTLLNDNYGFLDPWYFQNPYYTYDSEFSVLLHPGLDYTVFTRNVPEAFRKPTHEELNIMGQAPVKYTWRVEDLFPVSSEPYMAAISSYRASLHFQLISFKDLINEVTFIRDWPTLAEILESGYTKFISDDATILKAKCEELTSEISDPMERARKLYDFVRIEILTVDESIQRKGDGSLRKVLEARSGSSEQKNLLLIGLLKSAGIDAKPLLIATRYHAIFNPQIHSLRQFNYTICYANIGKTVLLLDGSERWVPFPHLPPYALVSGGLLLDGENSGPVTITAPKRNSGVAASSRLILSADGSAVCSTHITLSGHMLSSFKKLLDAKPSSDDVRENLMEESDPTFEMVDYQVTEIPGEDSVGIDMVLHFAEYCDVIEGNIVGAASLFSMKENPFKKAQRFFPVDFGFPYTISESVDLVCDGSLQLKTVPQNLSAAIDGIQYSRSVLQAGNQARIMSQFVVRKSLFAPAEYEKLRDTFSKVAAAGTDQFVAGSL